MIALSVQSPYSCLTVHASRIHGKGVFTEENIPTGALIYESKEYSMTTIARRGSIQRTPIAHLIEKVLRWENHSCVPNSRLHFEGSYVQLFATRSLLAGDEIVCDYRSTEDSIPIPFRCNCGSCSGTIIH